LLRYSRLKIGKKTQVATTGVVVEARGGEVDGEVLQWLLVGPKR
jgi:hypothetical protein